MTGLVACLLVEPKVRVLKLRTERKNSLSVELEFMIVEHSIWIQHKFHMRSSTAIGIQVNVLRLARTLLSLRKFYECIVIKSHETLTQQYLSPNETNLKLHVTPSR
jgi:hypothetical protein